MAEVDDSQVDLIVDQNVFKFQVTMAESSLVDMFNAIQKLVDIESTQVFIKSRLKFSNVFEE